MIARYQKRISGPALDRIDIHVTVPRVEFEKLAGDRLGEQSATIRARVENAREVRRERFGRRTTTKDESRKTVHQVRVRGCR
jgi:magnesium chelatase family protein